MISRFIEHYASMDGIKLVRIWESGCQAEREAGYDSTKISRVCNHKLPYYGKKNEDKYLWSFSELHDVETKD